MNHTPSRSLATPARRWRLPVSTLFISLTFLAGTLVLAYPSAASWFSQYNQSKTIGMLNAEVVDDDPAWLDDELERARNYNEKLVSGALLAPHGNVPTSDAPGREDLDYDTLLNVSSDGLMGRLKIPAIAVDLPIYHGTDQRTLERGVGHLQGTALPIGGTSTHGVLTAHRGLPEATMFNDLPELAAGDAFTLEVFGEVLAYRVVETRTVLPEETAALVPHHGRDLLTLVTCTPLGINSHRMLVTGERVVPTPVADLQAHGRNPEIPGFPWWALPAGAAILAAAGWVYLAGRPARERGSLPPRR